MNKLWITCQPTQSIVIRTASSAIIDLEYTVHYADIISMAFSEASVTGVFNVTETVALTPPAYSHSRVLRNFTVYNPNILDAEVYIDLIDSGSYYRLDSFTLSTDESYSSNGCLTSDGKLKLAS